MRLNSVSPLTIEMQTALLDLLLIHQSAGKYAAGYRQMEKAYKAGKVRAIGLSNFNKAQLEELEMKAFLKENGIVPQAWYTLEHGDKALLQESLFAQLGEKYGKYAPQIILRRNIRSSSIVIPGSKNPEHIKANFDRFDFALTDAEMVPLVDELK